MDIFEIYKNNIDSVKTWITNTLSEYEESKMRVSELEFAPVLSQFYQDSVLENSYVIYCDKIPVFPLAEIGIPALSEMNERSLGGITYLDCYFVRADHADDITLHFHELVHILQWKYLGIDRFLFCYAHGLLEKGYRNSPLEEMAYQLEDDVAGNKINVDSVVNQEMPYFEKLVEKMGMF